MATFSACFFVPLVRMSLRPGSRSMAVPRSGFSSIPEWSMSWAKSRNSYGLIPSSSMRPFRVVP
jgi:hypothetical protein